jgi:hypothetical protein
MKYDKAPRFVDPADEKNIERIPEERQDLKGRIDMDELVFFLSEPTTEPQGIPDEKGQPPDRVPVLRPVAYLQVVDRSLRGNVFHQEPAKAGHPAFVLKGRRQYENPVRSRSYIHVQPLFEPDELNPE